MNPEELKKIEEALQKKLDEATASLESKTVSKTDMDAKLVEIQNELKSLKENKSLAENETIKDLTKKLTDLTEQSNKQGTELTKISQFNIIGKAKAETLVDVLKGVFASEEIKEYASKRKGGSNKIELKLAGDMSESGNLTAGSVLITEPEPKRGIIELKTRPIHMRNILAVGTTTKDRIPVVKQANYEEGVDTKAENAASGQSDFDLAETYVNAERIPTHLTVSKDLLDDIPALISFIANHMPKRVMTKEDQQILFGTGNTPQICGVTTNATAFAAGDFATSIPAANEIDCLRVALANLTVAYYWPSHILMHPTDIAKIDLLKSTTREYLGNSFMIARDQNTGLISIGGIPIIGNTAMTSGYFCIGDFTAEAVELYDRKQLTMQMSDSHDTNFTKNLMTITFEERIALPIYYNAAFCYDDFATAKAAITSGS